MSRPQCHYGSKCYRMSLEHRKKFAHPEDQPNHNPPTTFPKKQSSPSEGVATCPSEGVATCPSEGVATCPSEGVATCPCGGGQSCIVDRRMLGDWVHEDDVFKEAGLDVRLHCYQEWTTEQERVMRIALGGVNK